MSGDLGQGVPCRNGRGACFNFCWGCAGRSKNLSYCQDSICFPTGLQPIITRRSSTSAEVAANMRIPSDWNTGAVARSGLFLSSIFRKSASSWTVSFLPAALTLVGPTTAGAGSASAASANDAKGLLLDILLVGVGCAVLV